MSSSGRKGLALGAATAIHYSVETELLAAQLVDDIEVHFTILKQTNISFFGKTSLFQIVLTILQDS
jgi:hypothetical protein